MAFVSGLLVGMVIGANIGLLVLALLIAAGEADERGVGE